MGNIIKAVLHRSTVCRTAPLYQYDYGQILQIVGPELHSVYEVHFSNQQHGTATTQIGGADGVVIPDAYLQTGSPVYAWLYLHTGENDGETEYSITIPVIARARPTNEPPTPVQQDAITEAIAALNSGVERAEAAADGIEQTVNDALAAAKTSGEFDGKDGTNGTDGIDGVTFTPSVSPSGVLSWSNDGGRQNPESVNIKGAPGQNGLDGMDGVDGKDGKDGKDGEDGSPGASAYVWIRYAAIEPTQDSDMKTTPDAWMGIYSGDSVTAPTAYTAYTWYNIKGQTGPVQDVQVNGVSVLQDGVANVPLASADTYGVVRTGSVSVSGTAPTITALPGIQYVCGEVATLDITLPASGIVDVVFESGSTATILTVHPPTGKTISWANGFDPSGLDADTTYEISISIVGDKCLGVAGSWS